MTTAADDPERPLAPPLSDEMLQLRAAGNVHELGVYAAKLTRADRRLWHRRIKYYAKDYPTEIRRASEPTEAVWRTLQRYAGEEMDTAIQAQGHEVDPVLANAARNNIRLADAYYDAYYDGRDEIQPTVLYYGSLNLAKAIIRVRLGRDDERDRGRSGHGITVLEPLLSIEEGMVTLRSAGDFADFLAALGAEPPPDQTTVRVYDLLRLIPELDDVMTELTGEGTRAIRADVMENELMRYDVSLQLFAPDGTAWVEELAALPALHARNAALIAHARQLVWRTAEWKADADFRALTVAGQGGTRYFERLLPNGLFIPQAAAMVAVQFFLSHLCRYRADEWLQALDKHPRAYSVIREFLLMSEIRLPNLVLDLLARREYHFLSR